jgi:hypothetical protein
MLCPVRGTCRWGRGVMEIRNTLASGYAVSFADPPPIGTQIRYWGGRIATLLAVTPYVRRDGSHSFLLTWETDTGKVGTTGLRSKAMTWSRDVERWSTAQ